MLRPCGSTSLDNKGKMLFATVDCNYAFRVYTDHDLESWLIHCDVRDTPIFHIFALNSHHFINNNWFLW